MVEDDAEVRELTVEMLRELGYTTLSASSGAEGLERLTDRDSIDLLLTDVVMPNMNGRQLAEKAQEMRPDVKVIFTTGYTDNAVVHNGILDAGVHLLQKPITLEALAVKVRDVLDG